jgi:hypothetical protein
VGIKKQWALIDSSQWWMIKDPRMMKQKFCLGNNTGRIQSRMMIVFYFHSNAFRPRCVFTVILCEKSIQYMIGVDNDL